MKPLPEPVRRELLRAVRAVEMLPDRVAQRSVVARPPRPADGYVDAVADHLYATWFARSLGTDDRGHDNHDLLPVLRAAHAATEHFLPGWRVDRVAAGGQAVIRRHTDVLDLAPGDYANLARPGAPARAGDAVAVTARRDAVDVQGGWWVTFGTVGAVEPDRMIRVYWNCPAGAIGHLVCALTAALESRGVRYTFKCPVSPELYDRADAAVAYLGQRDWALVTDALRTVHSRVASRLRPAIPPLTLRAGQGVGVAEDPGDGRSFGQVCARAVAEGVLAAWARGVRADDPVLETVAARLEALGLRPDRPHLRTDSHPDLVTAWSTDA